MPHPSSTARSTSNYSKQLRRQSENWLEGENVADARFGAVNWKRGKLHSSKCEETLFTEQSQEGRKRKWERVQREGITQ